MTHQLDVFQSLSAMEGLSATDIALPQQLKQIASAGFAGVDIASHPSVNELRDQTFAAVAETNLDITICAFAAGTDELQETLEAAQRVRERVRFINMIPDLQPWRVEECAEQVWHWLALGREAGIPVYIETHRMSLTQDLYFTLQLLDAVPELPMIADLSHTMVGMEFAFPPLTVEQQTLIQRVLERAESFQGRVASAQQIQLPLTFPQHQVWVDIFKDWWRRGFQSWSQRHAEDSAARLVFLCELLPPPYALTDSQGRELSDRWQDTLAIKSQVEALWQDLHK